MNQIEKCVVYIASNNPMARLNFVDIDGKQRVPITLPRLKILDDLEEDGRKKYHPYVVENYRSRRLSEDQLGKGEADGLTIRQRRAYELFAQGESASSIARGMKTSTDSVRNMIYKARVKLGLIKPTRAILKTYHDGY